MRNSGGCYCPQCMRRLDGRLVIEEQVWLARRCPDHGYVRTMLFESPEYLARAMTSAPPVHTHRCLVVGVTERCDVGCATCSASSMNCGNDEPAAVVIKRTVAAARDVGADVVALSGGEPLMREDVWEIADAVHSAVPKVVLITSGRRFESDKRIASAIAARAGWLEVYLQFDSLRDDVLRAIRTPSVTAEMRRERLRLAIATGAQTSAVCVVLPDSTDEEIGELAVFCHDEGASGVTFQPLRMLGRFPVSTHAGSRLSTVDHIQSVALAALGSSGAGAAPFAQQPLDISVALLEDAEVQFPETFFREERRPGAFRVATSSYWDHANYFEPFAKSGRYYFYVGRNVPLNSLYFQPSSPRRRSHRPAPARFAPKRSA